mgnify:CR=1 FL=1
MKKFVKLIIVLVVLILIAGGIFFLFGLNAVVRTGVEQGGSHFLKTGVTLKEVNLSPFSGRGTLKGLQIKNPEGFTEGNAFTLDHVNVELEPGSLFSDKIVINELVIDGPVITYDRALTKSNIGQLKKNVEALAGAEEKAPPEEKPEKKEGKQVALKHFVLENGKVRLTSNLVRGKAVTLSLPRIELNDIGTGDKKATAAEVVNQVYSAVLAAVVKAVNQSGAVLKAGGETLKNITEQAGNLDKVLESSGETVKDATDSVTKGIKGLLGGDKKEEEQ